MALSDRVTYIRDVLQAQSAAFPQPPKLIAVTKTATVEQILPLKEMGITDIAENRVQVLLQKLPELEGKFSIHLIGQLQSNKVKYIIDKVCMIHSVDRLPLAEEIDRQARRVGRRMDILLEVNVSGEEQKAGIAPEDVRGLFTACERLEGVRVRGLMTMLPLLASDARRIVWFTQLREIRDMLKGIAKNPEDVTELSMGMSGDYALAARCGATMVRVGSAIFHESSL